MIGTSSVMAVSKELDRRRIWIERGDGGGGGGKGARADGDAKGPLSRFVWFSSEGASLHFSSAFLSFERPRYMVMVRYFFACGRCNGIVTWEVGVGRKRTRRRWEVGRK